MLSVGVSVWERVPSHGYVLNWRWGYWAVYHLWNLEPQKVLHKFHFHNHFLHLLFFFFFLQTHRFAQSLFNLINIIQLSDSTAINSVELFQTCQSSGFMHQRQLLKHLFAAQLVWFLHYFLVFSQQSINLVCKTTGNSENCPSEYPWVQDDVFKCWSMVQNLKMINLL